MNCEKCQTGEMGKDRIYRMSGCLAVFGYMILLFGGLLMFGAFKATMGLGEGMVKMNQSADQDKEAATSALRQLNLPGHMVFEFEKTGSISLSELNTLSPEARSTAARIVSRYNSSASGRALGSSAGVACGGMMTMTMFIVGLCMLIPGFILVLKKNVWRCNNCGYIFDRA